MKPVRTSVQDAALVVAGALFSVAVGRYSSSQPADRAGSVIGLVTILAIGLLFYGANWWALGIRRYGLWARRGRGLIPAGIGILNDMGWDTRDAETFSWTNISPLDWVTDIQSSFSQGRRKVGLRLISTAHDFSSYFAILNPYGGVYPERDLKDAETLQKVFEYVAGGGVFVNVADIPGYWAYHPLLKRRLDATPPTLVPVRTADGRIGLIQPRFFMFTPFMQRLGLRILSVEKSPAAQWEAELADEFSGILPSIRGPLTIHRAAVVERNVKPILRSKPVESDEGSVNVTPFFLVEYGEGSFLICLVPHDLTENAEARNLVSAVIARLAR